MKSLFVLLVLNMVLYTACRQSHNVAVYKSWEGMKLVVDGEDIFVNGMNWDYFPVGTNFTYSLWDQPDAFIRTALDPEMSLLKEMGVNSIRVYTGIQPKWIKYIYEQYGIYTMLNHSFGRYGLTINGAWVANTDYADPNTKKLLLNEVQTLVEEYKDTPGLLLYLLGNENNYGLFWAGAETEDIPVDDKKSRQRAVHMYKLFNEAAVAMKRLDKKHPVALCNGDLLFNDIIGQECKDVDIFGVNMYRGVSFGDAFLRVRDELDKPILFTEFGADAFDAMNYEEDQLSQAYFMVGNWQEIYENAYGLGKAGNSIGGFTFQFSDGWWKSGQTINLDIQDTTASWTNGGYFIDYKEGSNNMNEEWFGICAKGPTHEDGSYLLYPRAAYYALKEVHRLNPFDPGITIEDIETHFEKISLDEAINMAKSDQKKLKKLHLKNQDTRAKN